MIHILEKGRDDSTRNNLFLTGDKSVFVLIGAGCKVR